MSYTIILTAEQRQLIIGALEKFSVFTLGQKTHEREDAKKLASGIAKSNTTVIDLSKQ